MARRKASIKPDILDNNIEVGGDKLRAHSEAVDEVLFVEDEFPTAQYIPPVDEKNNPENLAKFTTCVREERTTATGDINDNNKAIVVSFQELLDNNSISDTEELFIDVYMATLNKSRAIREAFPDMAEKDILKNANRLLEKPEIKRRVTTQVDQILNSDVARAPAILLRQCEIALQLDPLDFYTSDGIARQLDDISPEKRSFITDISVVTNNKTGESKIIYKLLDREKAISRLADIVTLLTKTRSAMGDSEFDPQAENAAKKRDEIFARINEPEDSDDDVEIIPKQKGKRGRPKKYFTKEDIEAMKNVTE